jgi:hypothetical protein
MPLFNMDFKWRDNEENVAGKQQSRLCGGW